MRPAAALALLSCLCAAQESKFELPAEQRTGTIRRIFVLAHSHLDIGFTRPPDIVARQYKDNIDAAIRLTRENPDFRWTIESAWMLQEWLRRTEDQKLIDELGVMLRDGRMGYGATYATMHSGLMAAEESNRLIYLGHRYRRMFRFPGTVAFQNDVPGFTWAYPRIFAGSGVKYLLLGLNLFIGGGNTLGLGSNPFYWVGPDGSRVLTYFTYDSYVEASRWKLSPRFSLEDLEKSVPRRLAWLERNGYKYDTYLLMASPGDNIHPDVASRTLERMREWNRKHPELPMRMATAEEFFSHLAQKYGDKFPEASGDAAGHWEIVKLRAPEVAAHMRWTSNLLPAAEAAAAIASRLGRRLYPRVDFADAWNSLLAFHEHTADAGTGWPGYFSRWDADWNNIAHYAAAMNGYSNTTYQFDQALHQLANASGRKEAGAVAMVYNGLPWTRSGPVVMDRLPAKLRDGPLAVEDLATGKPVAWETVPGTKRRILIFAKDVPSLGWRAFSIRPAEAAAPVSGDVSFDLEWNPSGQLVSLRDRATGRDLVRPDPMLPFGSLWIARGREDFRLEDAGPAEVKESDGPLVRRVEFARPASPLPLTVATLYRDAPYADLRFDVDIDRLAKASVSGIRIAIALPFSKTVKQFVDGAGFLVRVPEDILPGGKPPYFSPVHFVHFEQPGSWGVTVAHPDSFAFRPDHLFVLANEGYMLQSRDEGSVRLHRTEPRSSPVQSFHFRIAAHGKDVAAWKAFGAEANLPLRAVVTDFVPAKPQDTYAAVSDPRVHLLALKPAEFRPGWWMVRLQEISGAEVTGLKLTLPFETTNVEQANLVEEPTGRRLDPANLTLRPWETLTLLINPAAGRL